MYRILLSSAASAAFLLPVSALAEVSFSGAATLGYSLGELEVGGFDQNIDTLSLQGHGTLAFGEDWEVDLKLGYADSDLDNVDIGMGQTYISAAPRYYLPSDVYFGAYYEYADLDMDVLGFGLGTNFKSYGLTLGLENDNLDVEGHLGQSSSTLLTGTDIDITDIGLRADYAVSGRFQFGGHLIATNADSNALGGDVDLYSMGLGGNYAITEDFAAYAGARRQWIDEPAVGLSDASVTELGIGVAYAFSFDNSIPVTASLELVRSDLDLDGLATSVEGNEIRLGLSIPLGDRRQVLPQNSVSRRSFEGGRSAISSLLGLF